LKRGRRGWGEKIPFSTADIEKCPDLDFLEKEILKAVKRTGSILGAARLMGKSQKFIRRVAMEALEKLEKWGGVAAEQQRKIDRGDLSKLMEAREEKAKPILLKRLEAHAWFEHLLLDLGRDMLLLGLTNMGVPLEEIEKEILRYGERHEELRRKIVNFFASLLKVRQEAWRLRELEENLNIAETEAEFYRAAFWRTYMAYRAAIHSMCQPCRMRFLQALFLEDLVLGRRETEGEAG